MESSGGYKNLPFYKQGEIIYDFTVEFTTLYIKSRRTKDQMDQSARSGKQCIAEGYMQNSMEGRLKMLGVSRGSYEELLNDYQDFLRQNGYLIWIKDDPRSEAVRRLVYNRYNSYSNYKGYIRQPESAANCMICLINQTNRLLDQKMRWLEEKFVKEGGFRENLFRKRRDYQKGKI
ncbi:four helix bundle protein [Candidatus Gottesmanbacteria bacterium]|nr:four helix bundle protein [Candidatus Gottesmanbacteria bacterium]